MRCRFSVVSTTDVRNWPAVEAGSGKRLVFLHGYPLNHTMWTGVADALSDRRHVVLLDLPGYGLAREWEVPATLSGFADSVYETLTRKLPGPFVLVGHSFGGYVALEMYKHHPEQLEGLVLTDTRSEPDSPEAREKRLATVKRLADPSESLDVEETARVLVAPATWEKGGAVVDQIRTMVRDAPSSTIIATLHAIADRPDLTPVLSTIRVPTLVIWGEEDRLIPPSQTRAMVEHIPGSTGVGIPRAGHLPPMESRQAFTKAIIAFQDQRPLS
jgi:3-oxoadipate enol-lactonase